MTGASANRDEAIQAAQIARKALEDGDLAKAEKWASKSQNMHRTPEVERLIAQIKTAARGSTADAETSGQHRQAERPQANGRAAHTHGPDPGTPQPSSNGTHQPQQHQRRPASGSAPAGMGSGLHQRHGKRQPEPTPVVDPGTHEEKKVVAEILAAKDLYEILGLAKSATDDDVRKAYRKLALKLHPDKNKALHADDAFKAVGKAFACLSDPDKRAYYDRTGFESTAAAQAAQAATRQGGQGGGGGVQRGPGGMYYTSDFDPDEIFNMFFGGMNPNARVFRAHFGGGAPAQRRAAQQHAQPHAGTPGNAPTQDEAQRMLFNLLQFLPVLLLVLVSMYAASQKSPFSLIRDHTHYPEGLSTSRLEVPYFVKSTLEYERGYPRGSSSRFKLERQIESDYYDRQQQRCQTEKLQKHRMWAYGNRDEASRFATAGCDEVERMNQRLGLRNHFQWG